MANLVKGCPEIRDQRLPAAFSSGGSPFGSVWILDVRGDGGSFPREFVELKVCVDVVEHQSIVADDLWDT